MIEQKTITLGNVKVDVTFTTAHGDAHSKVGDNPSIVKGFWEGLIDLLDMIDEAIESIPYKEIRLSEGCK